METPAQFLERCKAATNSNSYSNLAHKIGVTRQYLHDVKIGKIAPSSDVMLDLALRAKLNPDEALILLNFWRSHGRAKARYAAMLSKSSATILALFFVTASPWAKNYKPMNYNDFSYSSLQKFENANIHYAFLHWIYFKFQSFFLPLFLTKKKG